MNEPSLSLQIANVNKNLYRIDVLFEEIPKNFLGAAFDIVMNDSEWKYEGYKLGPLFKKPGNAIALITKRPAPDNRIIFGVTLKRGFTIEEEKGILASFYADLDTNKNLEIQFQRGIISTFDGQRKDIPATWKNIDLKTNSPQTLNQSTKTDVLTKKPEPPLEIIETQEYTQQSHFSPEQKPENNDQWHWGIVSAVCLIMMVGIFFSIRKKHSKNRTK